MPTEPIDGRASQVRSESTTPADFASFPTAAVAPFRLTFRHPAFWRFRGFSPSEAERLAREANRETPAPAPASAEGT